MRLSHDASLLAVERVVEQGLQRECRSYNQRKPLITVIAHELNSRAGATAYADAVKSASARLEQSDGTGRQTRSRGASSGRGRGRPPAGVRTAPHCMFLLLSVKQDLNGFRVSGIKLRISMSSHSDT